MFINFWYAAAAATDIADRPQKVRMLGQDFVLYRDGTGEIRCLSNTCVHRGGSLGDGKCRDGRVACPYHGWEFDADGRCRKIPSLGRNASVPARARVDAYPTVQRYGIVFVFLGDLPEGDRPPILEVEEWDQPGWKVMPYTFEWPVNFTRSVENSLDAPHTEFVHSFGTEQGNRFTFAPEESRVEECGDWGAAHVVHTRDMRIEHGHVGVSHTWTFLEFPMGGKSGAFKFYTFITPIDEFRVRRFILHARNLQLEDRFGEYLRVNNAQAESEDRLVVQELAPFFSPRDGTQEFLLADDGIMARYRERLAGWTARGWRIDTERVAAGSRHTAFAIPAPARRHEKGWVLPEIPRLLSGAGA